MLQEGTRLQWVTRAGVRLDRTACAWLIRRFIDPQGTILYVAADMVPAAVAEGALPFHITSSEDPDFGERTSFDLLLAEYKLDQQDAALALMGDIIRGAELKDPDAPGESEGLRAITKGMNALAGGDEEMAARMAPVFDALYSYCLRRVTGQRDWANAEPSEKQR